jgi:hypothetical protein
MRSISLSCLLLNQRKSQYHLPPHSASWEANVVSPGEQQTDWPLSPQSQPECFSKRAVLGRKKQQPLTWEASVNSQHSTAVRLLLFCPFDLKPIFMIKEFGMIFVLLEFFIGIKSLVYSVNKEE